MARTIIVQPGQCLEDIALQEYGSIDGVTLLLLDNTALLVNGYSTDLQAGDQLSVRDEPVALDVYTTMKAMGIIPSTNTDVSAPQVGDGGDFNDDFNDDFNIQD